MFQRCATIRKEVAACIAVAWLVLFGIVFAEGLGLYQDTPENLDQQMEQVLSSDATTDAQPSDFVSVAHLSVAVVGSPSAFDTLCVSPRFSINSGERIARMTKSLELYRLHSTYLI